MLVTCIKTGLTYARKVYREGDIFILTGAIERAYKDLSAEAWARKQKKIYSGEVVFRQPTSEEIIAAIRDKKLDPGSASVRGHLSKKQLRIALDYAESKEAKKLTAIRMLKDSVDMEIEDAPEEKVEVVKAPEKEPEAPKEKVEPIELPEESVKDPAEEAPEAPPEEPVKDPVEEPKKEAEAPPEEPVKDPVEELKKEASGKKDKK